MPVYKTGNSIEDGLNSLSMVIGGALQAEQTNYQRDLEERNYQFDRERFDEGVRQFDLSFEEGVRQFEANMAFNTEQADLNRQHDITMQDDQQSFLAEDREDRQVFQEQEAKRDRAVQYHRINESVRMQNADRALKYDQDWMASYQRYLGSADSYDSMPDFYAVGADGSTYNADHATIYQEMQAIAQGQQSGLFGGKLTPEVAQTYIQAMDQDPSYAVQLADDFLKNGMLNVVPNSKKSQGLEELLLQSVGGDQQALASLSPQERAQREGAIIHKLNNLGQYEKRIVANQADLYAARRGAELGTSAYENPNPVATLAGMNDQPFYFDTMAGAPMMSNGQSMEMQTAFTAGYQSVVSNRNALESAETPQEAERIMQSADRELKKYREDMRAQLRREGKDPAWADKMYRYNTALLTGEVPNFDDFVLSESSNTPVIPNSPAKDRVVEPKTGREAELQRAMERTREAQGQLGKRQAEITREEALTQSLFDQRVEQQLVEAQNAYLDVYGEAPSNEQTQRWEERIRKGRPPVRIDERVVGSKATGALGPLTGVAMRTANPEESLEPEFYKKTKHLGVEEEDKR